MLQQAVSPEFDLTLRVGCSLAYEATGPASLILDIKPRPDGHNHVLFEALSLGDNLPYEEFTDFYGNTIPPHEPRAGGPTLCGTMRSSPCLVQARQLPRDGIPAAAAPGRAASPRAPALHAPQQVLRFRQAHQLRLGKVRQRRARMAPGPGDQQVDPRELRVPLHVRPGRHVGLGRASSAATESAAISPILRSRSTGPSTSLRAMSRATCPTSAFRIPRGTWTFTPTARCS